MRTRIAGTVEASDNQRLVCKRALNGKGSGYRVVRRAKGSLNPITSWQSAISYSSAARTAGN